MRSRLVLPEGVREPAEIRCAFSPGWVSECERQRAGYQASYSASTDPQMVSLMIRGLLTHAGGEHGEGEQALAEYDSRFLG